MKTIVIAKEYGINKEEFEQYLRKNKLGNEGLFSFSLDENIEEHVEKFKEENRLQKEKVEEEIVERKRKEEEKRKALSSMLITSGFSFDGYKVVKYSGYISGDDCKTMPRDSFWDENKVEDNLCKTLVAIRRQAIKELKEAAYELGCNAVIGVDFDYMTMDPQHSSSLNASVTVYEPYVICVTANGNAVVIEKE